jgi:hypothetical protein
MPLDVQRSDLFRATLSESSGNGGYLGFAPDGSAYHVVVPVDPRLARGLKAWERPGDGTPFGGYRDWLYFQCDPYGDGAGEARDSRVEANARRLRNWAAAHALDLRVCG